MDSMDTSHNHNRLRQNPVGWPRAFLILIVVALAGLTGCQPPSVAEQTVVSPTVTTSPTVTPPPTPTPLSPLELTVLHTNDTWGYLSPCG